MSRGVTALSLMRSSGYFCGDIGGPGSSKTMKLDAAYTPLLAISGDICQTAGKNSTLRQAVALAHRQVQKARRAMLFNDIHTIHVIIVVTRGLDVFFGSGLIFI